MVPLFSTKSLMTLCLDPSQPALGPAPGPGGQRRRWRSCPQPGGQREKMVCSSACSSVGERWLLVSLLTAMVELQVDNSCTATKTTFILAS